jgi:hypothetical protein
MEIFSGSEGRKYVLGSSSCAGHSMSNYGSERRRALPTLPPAWRTRTAAKHPLSVLLVSSCQLMFRSALLGTDCATTLTLRGCSAAEHLDNTSGRPMQLEGFGGSG